MKVKVIATEAVKKLAAKAYEIQDACNGRAVAGYLSEVMTHFGGIDSHNNGQEHRGGDMVNQNPITKAVILKLCHLAQLDQDHSDMSISHCIDLAQGKDVEIEIVPLM